jgi:ribosomal protein S18 acetylase RimI-like enzyme
VSILETQLRSAAPEDAVTIAALAVQVFLDTYAAEGIRTDLAVEAFAEYSVEAFAVRLHQTGRRFLLAEQASGLIGFSELQASPLAAPVGSVVGSELVRLYIQPQSQRRGVGRLLLQAAESTAADAALTAVWLTAWEGNHRARNFYASNGYNDLGATTYTFQGNTYGNRVLVRQVGAAASAA